MKKFVAIHNFDDYGTTIVIKDEGIKNDMIQNMRIENAKKSGNFSENVKPLNKNVVAGNGFSAKLFEVDGEVRAVFIDGSSIVWNGDK